MKGSTLYLTLIFSFAFLCANAQVSYKSKVIFKINKCIVENIDSMTSWVLWTTLTNVSNDTLNIVSKSCSWHKFYVIDKEELVFDELDCDETDEDNILITGIPPKQSQTTVLRVFKKENKDKSPIRFRVGLYLVNESEFNLSPSVVNTISNVRIIWSNSILAQHKAYR